MRTESCGDLVFKLSSLPVAMSLGVAGWERMWINYSYQQLHTYDSKCQSVAEQHRSPSWLCCWTGFAFLEFHYAQKGKFSLQNFYISSSKYQKNPNNPTCIYTHLKQTRSENVDSKAIPEGLCSIWLCVNGGWGARRAPASFQMNLALMRRNARRGPVFKWVEPPIQ